jgi:cytosine/adenosine deaminase-related metal-dependent hydrolase
MEELLPDETVYDLKGNLVIPDFWIAILTFLNLSEEVYDNLHLTQWLVTMSTQFDLTEEETIKHHVGLYRSLKSGTTTVAEMASSGPHLDAAIQAIADSGLRAMSVRRLVIFRRVKIRRRI